MNFNSLHIILVDFVDFFSYTDLSGPMSRFFLSQIDTRRKNHQKRYLQQNAD